MNRTKGVPADYTLERECERILFYSMLVSTVPILPSFAVVALSGSVSFFALTLKTTNEGVATTLAWMVARKIAGGESHAYDYGLGKMESLVRIVTGGLILASIIMVVAAALYRILNPAPLDPTGVAIAILILIISIGSNVWFWVANHRVAIRVPTPLMDSEWQLFRLKAAGNGVVLAALLLGILCAGLPFAEYIDPVASLIVIVLLLYSGYGMILSSLPDLLDRTLEEELQMVVIRELAGYFEHYKHFHGVRSRRSGGRVYIEILLEFEGSLLMCEVQEIINRMKRSLEEKIPKSSVNIVPTTGSGHRVSPGNT